MAYTVKRKGRVICKIKPNSLTIKALVYLIDTLGYTLHGTYNGVRETLKENKINA